MPALSHGQRLRQIGTMVDGWMELVTKPPLPLVHPNSSLARDDAESMPARPLSHLAWHGILTAVDHLAMFMQALENGRSFSLAPQTLARSGLLGAAHAVWLLQPLLREPRVQRALRLAHKEADEERKAINEMAKLPMDGLFPTARAQRATATQDQLDRCNRWMQQAVAIGAQRGFAGVAAAPVDTTLIELVIKESQASGALDAKDRDVLASYLIMWRTHSGTAHGYVWPALYRTRATVGLPTGGGIAHISMNEEEQVMSAAAVATLTSRAIQLFGARNSPPAS